MFGKKRNSDKIEVLGSTEVKKGIKFKGSLKPHRGHTLFKVDKKTLEITPAKIEKDDEITWDSARKKEFVKRKKSAIMEEGFAYFTGLNKASIIKQLKKIIDPAIVDHMQKQLDKK